MCFVVKSIPLPLILIYTCILCLYFLEQIYKNFRICRGVLRKLSNIYDKNVLKKQKLSLMCGRVLNTGL